jgi:hypothetical protein
MEILSCSNHLSCWYLHSTIDHLQRLSRDPGLLADGPAGAVMGFIDTGYMRENHFQMYIEHFVNSISPARPVLLMLDDHKSHINYTSVDFCRANNILLYLYALPPCTYPCPPTI